MRYYVYNHSHSLFVRYFVSFFLEETLMHPLMDLRVEDFEFVDSKVGFFPKIRVLWIQAHILFIFRGTTMSVGIRASQHFNQGSKML
ncbi:unnamed protein product [Spirodela intermedia]|uniref:Uncharacterized protein n=1 Tax=Spirodela intermedia TaxID=51605 RepID=A0A7I8IRK3_SPIIN|nr:unnamed protein product [Spirodela intermedia]CAA6659591.1 unnamed protein product [Spirodela intermedia]